jgi:maltoporin
MLAIAAALLALATPANAVDLHGYFRSAVGTTSNGGNQVALQNYGQDYKLRLGNEDNWSEFEFVQPLLKDKEGAEWSAGFMIDWGNGWTNSYDPANFGVEQAYIRGKLPQLNGATLWGGRRFYHRHANDIFDYFYLNASGTGGGAGVEDIETGFGKLQIAIFKENYNVDDSTSPTGKSDVASKGAWRPDVRLEGIPVNPNGTLSINLLGRFRSYNTKLGAVTTGLESFAPYIMVEHNQTGFLGGSSNNLAVWYESAGTGGGGQPSFQKDTSEIGVSEQLLLQPVPNFSAMVAGLYQHKQTLNAASEKVKNNAYAIAVRPVFQVNSFFKIQGDLGYFYNKNDTSGAKENTMVKGTIAPTFSPAPDSNAWGVRPEIRFYVTYASWNKEQTSLLDSKGNAAGPGGGAFGTSDSGTTFGTQIESWF